MAVLVAELANPTGYGRILRDAEGKVAAIVEQKDANDEQRRIRTINTGILTAESTALRRWLAGLSNDNAQAEFYLTDVFASAAADFTPADMVHVADPQDVEGANDPWQLAQLERAWQLRAARTLCLQGVRMADPARVEQRGSVQVGRDVQLDIDVILEGNVTLGDDVVIGPFVRLRDVTLGAGTQVRAHSDLEGVITEGAVQIGPFARLRPAPCWPMACISAISWKPKGHHGRRQQGQPSDLSGRCGDRQQGQHRCRHHHLQLRRGEQVTDHHRRWRLYRLQ